LKLVIPARFDFEEPCARAAADAEGDTARFAIAEREEFRLERIDFIHRCAIDREDHIIRCQSAESGPTAGLHLQHRNAGGFLLEVLLHLVALGGGKLAGGEFELLVLELPKLAIVNRPRGERDIPCLRLAIAHAGELDGGIHRIGEDQLGKHLGVLRTARIDDLAIELQQQIAL
jgi:hypothetical protein